LSVTLFYPLHFASNRKITTLPNDEILTQYHGIKNTGAVLNLISMTGVTCGAGTANPSGALEFTPGFSWFSLLLDL